MGALFIKSEDAMNSNDYSWLYAKELPKGKIKLEGEGVRHLRVKRVKPFEKLSLFDGKGNIAVCKYLGNYEIQALELHQIQKTKQLAIAVAVPKGERADWMLQKTAELGTATIIPLQCEHSVVIPGEQKQERWQNILIEGCKQSKNPWVPELKPLMTIKEALEEQAGLRLVLEPSGKPVKQALESLPDKTIAFIGPEAGFTNEEKKLFEQAGCIPVSLGKNILRIETAAIAVATAHNLFK
jgi:16S rRNA (uracil1498-N3)-methyltransferase